MCVCVCCKFVAFGQDCQHSVGTVVTFYDLALEASCEGSYIYIRLLLPSSSLVLVLLHLLLGASDSKLATSSQCGSPGFWALPDPNSTVSWQASDPSRGRPSPSICGRQSIRFVYLLSLKTAFRAGLPSKTVSWIWLPFAVLVLPLLFFACSLQSPLFAIIHCSWHWLCFAFKTRNMGV